MRVPSFAVLLVPPDSAAMGGGADDVIVTVAVEVIDVHLGLRLTKGGGVEGPRFGGLFRGTLPPAARHKDVVHAVLVDVADAEAMIEVDDLHVARRGHRTGLPFDHGIALRPG